MRTYWTRKTVGAIVTYGLSATGLALDAQQVLPLAIRWLPFIGFVIFGVLVFLRIRELYKENVDLVNALPRIETQVKKVKNALVERYYIVVSNKGAEGIFYAQIEFDGSNIDAPDASILDNYQGIWRKTNKSEAFIAQGHNDWIHIADREPRENVGVIDLHTFIQDPTSDRIHSMRVGQHSLARVEDEKGNVIPNEKDKYELKVTISSSPRMQDGAYVQHYTLSVDGLRTVTNPLLNPDTQDYPTELAS